MKQTEFVGFESIDKLKETLTSSAPSKIMLITGKKSYLLSGAEKVLTELLKDYQVVIYNDFSTNPKFEEIEKGVAFIRKSNFDIMIAIGGGSVIDFAKTVNLLAIQKGKPQLYISQNSQIGNKGRFLIAIPTTSGSGAEATHFSVFYHNKIKCSLEHKYLLPDLAIVDPQFTLDLPPYITASSGMDAVCQAIEAYWGINSTDQAKAYAREAMVLGIENIEAAVNHPSRKTRETMSRAAHLSGKAIDIVKTSGPHAISYPITSYYGVAHGHAVALSIAAFLDFNYKCNEADVVDKRGVEYVRRTVEEICSMFNCKSVLECKQKIRGLLERIGLVFRLSELGIETIKDIEVILKNINLERLKNNPRRITKTGIKNLLLGVL